MAVIACFLQRTLRSWAYTERNERRERAVGRGQNEITDQMTRMRQATDRSRKASGYGDKYGRARTSAENKIQSPSDAPGNAAASALEIGICGLPTWPGHGAIVMRPWPGRRPGRVLRRYGGQFRCSDCDGMETGLVLQWDQDVITHAGCIAAGVGIAFSRVCLSVCLSACPLSKRKTD